MEIQSVWKLWHVENGWIITLYIRELSRISTWLSFVLVQAQIYTISKMFPSRQNGINTVQNLWCGNSYDLAAKGCSPDVILNCSSRIVSEFVEMSVSWEGLVVTLVQLIVIWLGNVTIHYWEIEYSMNCTFSCFTNGSKLVLSEVLTNPSHFNVLYVVSICWI